MKKSSKPLFYIGFGLAVIGVVVNSTLAYTTMFHVSLVGNARLPWVVIGFTAVAALRMWLLAIGGGYTRIRRYIYGR